MSNNKQSSSVDWLITEIQRRVSIIQSEPQTMARELMIDNLSVDLEQAKAMHKDESVDFALYAMMAESFNDLPEATKNQLREAIKIKYKEYYKL